MPQTGSMSWKHASAKFAVALAAGALIASVPALVGLYLRDAKPQRITRCESEHQDGYEPRVRVWFESQDKPMSLAPLELGAEHCPPEGGMLEKRPGDFGFRVDGELLADVQPEEHVAVVQLGVLLLALAAGLRIWGRHEQHLVPQTGAARFVPLIRGLCIGLMALLLLLTASFGGEVDPTGMMVFATIGGLLLGVSQLLGELVALDERIPAPPRRWRLPLLLLGLAGAIALWFVAGWELGASADDGCHTAAASLDPRQHQERSMRARAGFERHPNGARAFAQLDDLLEKFAHQAAALYLERCHELPVEHRQIHQFNDAQLLCLRERSEQLADVLRAADQGPTPQELLQSAAELATTRTCRSAGRERGE